MKYPALDIVGVDHDLLQAFVDDFAPTAAEQRDDQTTVFFADPASRTLAHDAIAGAWPSATLAVREVDDEDWARRSQENLTPITVGRVTVTPPWCATSVSPASLSGTEQSSPTVLPPIVIVIAPSMGFGTGHHATTRLCLAALQALDLTDRVVLDVGTGSGVLALAARRLGAREATGIDYDPDAIQSAEENLAANPDVSSVRFLVGDLRAERLQPADVVTANLTGALLVQTASLLRQAVRPGGTLILSGLLAHETADVLAAFSSGVQIVQEAEEQGWIGLTLTVLPASTPR